MATPTTSGVALRYASALLELALEDKALDGVEKDVEDLRKMLSESADLRRLVASPVFSTEDQVRALSAVLAKAKITGLAGNFVKLAAANRRLFVLPAMLKAFQELLSAHRGETVAVITSAEPLSEEHTEALTAALAEKAGGTVKLETHVDPSLIGGLIVRLGSQMIDTSVKTRLQGIKAAMKEAA
ncbi:MAG: F0F1 ATP synthase subunit delta [Pseudomonadota bacterium]